MFTAFSYFCVKIFGIKKSAVVVVKSEMGKELERLKTFGNWPHSFIDPGILAKTGFYYTGYYDQVTCHFCDIALNYWQRGDGEVGEHRRWSPECDLLQRRNTNNVPLGPIFQLNALLSRDGGYDGIRPGSCTEIYFTPSAVENQNNLEICKICYMARINVVLIPCGHVVACNKCAVHVANCPACRRPIQRYLKIYFT